MLGRDSHSSGAFSTGTSLGELPTELKGLGGRKTDRFSPSCVRDIDSQDRLKNRKGPDPPGNNCLTSPSPFRSDYTFSSDVLSSVC